MRLLLVTLFFVLTACGKSQDVAPLKVANPPKFLTPSFISLASAPRQQTLHFLITAPRSRALYLAHCYGDISWGLEHQKSNDWVFAWGPDMKQCLSVLEIAAGTRREFHRSIDLRRGEVLPPGKYRLVVAGLYYAYDASDNLSSNEVPHEWRISQSFTLAIAVAP